MERADMVERELREEIRGLRKETGEIKDTLTKIQVSITKIETKQNSTFNIGSWVINTLITIALTTVTIFIGGNFIKK